MRTILIAAALSLATAPLCAQRVSGVVRDSTTNAPMAGAVVTLVPADASRAARSVISDESGRFSILAPGPGSYTLETKRISMRRVASPRFTLGEGEARTMNVAVNPAVIALGTVVTAPSTCGGEVASSASTRSVWDEASTALTNAKLARDLNGSPFVVSRTTRVLDVGGSRVMEQHATPAAPLRGAPFMSPPADRLAERGFVQHVGSDSLVFYAPDVATLNAEPFVRTHCFTITQGTGDRAGFMGIAFEPTSSDTLPNVAGTLWLDRSSLELRSIDFHYVHLPFQPGAAKLGGELELNVLPSGAFYIERWAFRLPRFTMQRVGLNPAERRVSSLLEEGGVVAPASEKKTGGATIVTGVVFDSTTGKPLGGARVGVPGAATSVIADAQGNFKLQLTDTGAVTIAFSHPRVDSLGLDLPTRSVSAGGGPISADLAVPSAGTVIRTLCGRDDVGMLRVYLRDASDKPIAKTQVEFTAPPSSIGGPMASDDAGVVTICGLPAGQALHVTIKTVDGRTGALDVTARANEILFRPLAIK